MGKFLAALAAIKEVWAIVQQIIGFFKREQIKKEEKKNEETLKAVEDSKNATTIAEVNDAQNRIVDNRQ